MKIEEQRRETQTVVLDAEIEKLQRCTIVTNAGETITIELDSKQYEDLGKGMTLVFEETLPDGRYIRLNISRYKGG